MTMAARTLEARFEQMSVNDENELQKSKVSVAEKLRIRIAKAIGNHVTNNRVKQ